MPGQGKVLVQGINLRKKHQRPKKEGEKGQVVEKPGPVHVSKVKLVCSKCGKPARTSVRRVLRVKSAKQKKTRLRICKKCKKEI